MIHRQQQQQSHLSNIWEIHDSYTTSQQQQQQQQQSHLSNTWEIHDSYTTTSSSFKTINQERNSYLMLGMKTEQIRENFTQGL
jgi:hypothetical protein